MMGIWNNPDTDTHRTVGIEYYKTNKNLKECEDMCENRYKLTGINNATTIKNKQYCKEGCTYAEAFAAKFQAQDEQGN